MDPDVEVAYIQNHQLACVIFTKMNDELNLLGIDRAKFSLLNIEDATYALQKDPCNGQYSLIGEWYNHKKYKVGSLMFSTEGQFYVEQDVLLPHPKKKKWFIEAVTAWGDKQQVKSELKLTPNLAI